MAHLPRFFKPDEVNTPANYESFCTFFTHFASEEERAQLVHLYSIQHRTPWHNGIVALPVVSSSGQSKLPARFCDEPQCIRCTTGRGGWRFPWVDSRWTPLYAKVQLCPGAPIASNISQNLCSRPWPEGVHRPPSSIVAQNSDAEGHPRVSATSSTVESGRLQI